MRLDTASWRSRSSRLDAASAPARWIPSRSLKGPLRTKLAPPADRRRAIDGAFGSGFTDCSAGGDPNSSIVRCHVDAGIRGTSITEVPAPYWSGWNPAVVTLTACSASRFGYNIAKPV